MLYLHPGGHFEQGSKRGRIKVYNSNSMYRQIASHSGFEALKKELGSLYRPYDENDYTVELYIRS